MRKLIVVLAVLALSGCSTFKGTFENRAVCTVSGGQMMAVSLYGPLGIASKISAEDAAAVCGSAPAK